jgi:hypothetical protein
MDSPELIRRFDDLIRTDLTAWRDWFFGWMIASTVVVAAGVVLEGLEYVPKKFLPEPRFNLGTGLPVPSHFHTWIERLLVLGWFLVSVGVVGEFAFEPLTSRMDGYLQQFNNILINAAQSQSASALERATSAELDLAQAKADAESAKALTKGYESQIADSKARSTEAEARAAEARAMAEAEQVERRNLEVRLGPRSLGADDQRRIIEALRNFRGHATRVESYGLDGEGAALGAQLISVLTVATGVPPIDARANSVVSGGFDNGVHIRGPASEQDFMASLATALRDIGHLFVVVNGATFRPGMTIAGGVVMAGGVSMAGGGGGPVVPPIPTTGPVVVFVGIKPVPILLVR